MPTGVFTASSITVNMESNRLGGRRRQTRPRMTEHLWSGRFKAARLSRVLTEAPSVAGAGDWQVKVTKNATFRCAKPPFRQYRQG